MTEIELTVQMQLQTTVRVHEGDEWRWRVAVLMANNIQNSLDDQAIWEIGTAEVDGQPAQVRETAAGRIELGSPDRVGAKRLSRDLGRGGMLPGS